MTRLERSFFSGDALEVAPQLLNKVLVSTPCSGRIVEVEAYRQDDPASHARNGPTPRCRSMFGAPGHLYVYFTYGMHHCANIVTGAEHDGQAVLIRSVIPLAGREVMRRRRRGVSDRHLADGPGKVCQAFDLDRRHDGLDLVVHDDVFVIDDGVPPPAEPRRTPRVGIRHGTELLWRFVVASHGVAAV